MVIHLGRSLRPTPRRLVSGTKMGCVAGMSHRGSTCEKSGEFRVLIMAQGGCRRSPRVVNCGPASSIERHQLFDPFCSDVEKSERASASGEKCTRLHCPSHKLPCVVVDGLVLRSRSNYGPVPSVAAAAMAIQRCAVQTAIVSQRNGQPARQHTVRCRAPHLVPQRSRKERRRTRHRPRRSLATPCQTYVVSLDAAARAASSTVA